MSLVNFLLQDFPFLIVYKKALRVVLILCSLSFLFVLTTGYVFAQPGQKASSLAFIILFMIGGSQLLSRVVIPSFFKSQFSESQWTVGKEILWILLESLMGLLICYVLLVWIWKVPEGPYLDYTVKSVVTVFVGLHIFLIPLSIYLKREIVLHDYLQKAKTLNMLLLKRAFRAMVINNHDTTIKLKSNDESEGTTLPINDILLFKGAQNYVEVHYILGQQVERVLLRNTLKSLFKDLEDFKSFIFCHRSYIINIQKVRAINGNSRGYKILLENYDEYIPVSRRNALEFEAALGRRK